MGIGEAIALALAAKGMNVALLARSKVSLAHVEGLAYNLFSHITGQAGLCENKNHHEISGRQS